LPQNKQLRSDRGEGTSDLTASTSVLTESQGLEPRCLRSLIAVKCVSIVFVVVKVIVIVMVSAKVTVLAATLNEWWW